MLATVLRSDVRANCVGICIPNVVLRSVFKDSAGSLNFCHVNGGSLHPKIDQFRRIFEGSKAHIVAASETWFKSYRTNLSVAMDGYDVIRNDRHVRRSGGVVVYVKKGLKVKVVRVSKGIKSEYLFFEVIFPNFKILVGVYYKAPGVDEIDEVDDILSELVPLYSDVVLMGDFNENLLLHSSDGVCRKCVLKTCSTCRFRLSLDRFGLESLGASPTNFDRTPSLIDLILTNSPKKFTLFNQVGSGLSNHDIVFGTFSSSGVVTEEKPKYWRNYRNVDVSRLCEDVAESNNLGKIYACTNVDNMIEVLNSELLGLLNRHAPLKVFRPKPTVNSTVTWFTSEIDKAIIDREIAKKNKKSDPTPANVELFNALRNKVNDLVKNAKDRYLRPKLDCNLGMRNLWRNVKGMGLVASVSSSPAPSFTADEFNVHTTGHIASSEDTASDTQVTVTSSNVSSVPTKSNGLQFSFRNVDEAEVCIAVGEVKSDAVGIDEIPLKFLKLMLPAILPYMTHVFNYSITSSSCPSVWKVAKALPVHKKTKSYELDDYRSISILQTLSKVFEILLRKQIQEFIFPNRLLTGDQSAYRRAHSTTTALLKISRDVKVALDRKMVAILLLLDFSKAFDSVNHDILCAKLRTQFFFGSTAVALIRSYLTCRSQAVVIGDVFSEFLPTSKGVPQGSVLGPLLFSLFINDMPGSLKFMVSHLFADDVQTYKVFSSVHMHDSVKQINEDVRAVDDWAAENQLLLNADKTQAIVFGSNSNFSVPLVYLHGKSIPFTRTVKNLGMVFNERVTWLEQAGVIAKKVYASLRSLWPAAARTPLRTRVMLAKALLLPHFSYGCEIYSYGLDSYSRKPIDRAFKSVIRYVYGLPRLGSAERYIDRFLGCSLEGFFKVRAMCLIRKILMFGEPPYLRELFQLGFSTRMCNLNVPRNGAALSRSLFVRGVTDWNSLPTELRGVDSHSQFRDRCLRFFNGA